jgi:hypothetical protein
MKETAKALKKAIMEEFDGYLMTVGFKKTRHHSDEFGFFVIYRKDERYIRFTGNLHPRDYPFDYSISFGEGSNEYPESGWNSISINSIIKSESLIDFEKCKEVFSIRHENSHDEMMQKFKLTHEFLEKYGKSFINNDLDQFRKLRAEHNKNRWTDKIPTQQTDKEYKIEYEKQISELRKKLSK